jgi:hypothetical protein
MRINRAEIALFRASREYVQALQGVAVRDPRRPNFARHLVNQIIGKLKNRRTVVRAPTAVFQTAASQ